MLVRNRSFGVGVLAAGVMTLAACGSGETATPAPDQEVIETQTQIPEPKDSASTSPSSTSTVEEGALPERSAAVGECFKMTTRPDFTRLPEPVECVPGQYTAKTVAVLDLPDDLPLTYPERQAIEDAEVAGTPVSEEQQELADEFTDALGPLRNACAEEMNEQLPLSMDSRNRLTLFTGYVTGPNEDQWNAGERWARCTVARSLPADRKRDNPKFLPLPPDDEWSNARDDFVNQFCYLSNDDGQRVTRCNAESKWMKVLAGLKLDQLSVDPEDIQSANTDDDVLRLLDTACLTLVEPLVKDEDELENYDISVTASYSSELADSSFAELALDDGTTFNCSIPSWSYFRAPLSVR